MLPKSLPLAAAAAASIATQVHAQGWTPMDARRPLFDAQVEAGVLTGAVTDGEANNLRAGFEDIARLEAGYRARGGPQAQETADLQRRFDALTAQLDRDWSDDVRTDWPEERLRNDAQPQPARLAAAEQMFQEGVRNRTLDAAEAQALGAELQAIKALAARADVDQRLEAFEAQVHGQRADADFAPAPAG